MLKIMTLKRLDEILEETRAKAFSKGQMRGCEMSKRNMREGSVRDIVCLKTETHLRPDGIVLEEGQIEMIKSLLKGRLLREIGEHLDDVIVWDLNDETGDYIATVYLQMIKDAVYRKF